MIMGYQFTQSGARGWVGTKGGLLGKDMGCVDRGRIVKGADGMVFKQDRG